MENALLEQMLGDKFGYFLLQIGAHGHQEALAMASGIRTKVCVLPAGATNNTGGKVVWGEPTALPVATDSIDLVVLPHVLDFAKDPHQILREVERVLIPGGSMIVFGFSPWSLWGVWRLFHWRSNSVPWCGQFISPQRMRDWLSLLGFDIQRCDGLMFRPPMGRKKVMQRMQVLERMGARFWPPFSGVYGIQAVKRVSKLTPIKPQWGLRSKRIKGRVIEPAARSWKSD